MAVTAKVKGRRAGASSGASVQKLLPGSRLSPPTREAGLGRAADGHERQACDAAERFTRGERGLARLLSPVASASHRVPASRGEPLPNHLRLELEESFGADLGAVRVHRDAPADAAARRERALSFTSGAEVYFAGGAYRPESAAGRELVAHEVAHVLQQTGRRGADGGLRATIVRGPGDIQCAEWPEFKRLVFLHEPADKKDDARYRVMSTRILDRVVKGHPAWKTEEKQRVELGKIADEVMGDLDTYPGEAESLLYDCLKAAGRFDKAIELLERDDFAGGARIRTVLESEEVTRRLKESDDVALYSKVLEKFAAPKYAWATWPGHLAEFLRTTMAFLFQPASETVPIWMTRNPADKLKTFKTYETELQAALTDPDKVSENEWNLEAIRMLIRIDDLRRGKFEAADAYAAKKVSAGKEGAAQHKKHRLQSVKDWLQELLGKGAPGLPERLIRERGEELAKIVKDAYAVWERVDVLKQEWLKSLRTWLNDPDSSAAASVFRGFLDLKGYTPRAAKLRAVLEDLAEALLDDGKDGLRPPLDPKYSGICVSFAERLRTEALPALDEGIHKLLIQKRTDLLEALLLTQIWTDEMMAAFLERARGYTDPDRKLSHYIQTAGRLLPIAAPLKWKKVSDASWSVRQAKEEKQSQIALVTDWGRATSSGKREPDATDLEGLMRDFSADRVVKGYEPLTVHHITLVLRASYYQALDKELETLLPKTAKEHTESISEAVHGTYKPLLNQAFENIRETHLPQRFLVEEYEFALKENDRDFAALLGRHPKTKAFAAEEQAKDRLLIYPDAPGTVFAWSFPALHGLAAELRAIPALQGLVNGRLSKLKRSEDESALEWFEWWQLLNAAAKEVLANEADKERAKEIGKAVLDRLVGKQNKAWTEFAKNQEKAVSHHREVVAKSVLIPLLEAYEDDRYAHWNAPVVVARQINWGFYSPDERTADSYRLQRAALFLEIEPARFERIEYLRRLDVIGMLLEPLREANSDLAQRRDAVRKLLPAGERSESTFVSPRAADVAKVLARFEKVHAAYQTASGIETNAGKKVVYNLGFGHAIPADVTFQIEGKWYTIDKVHHSFVYHPAVEPEPAKLLKPDSDQDLGVPATEVLLEYTVSWKTADGKKLQRRPVVVRADAPGMKDLEELTRILGIQSFLMRMEALERGMEFGIEVLSWVPGVGVAVDAARLLATLADFWLSPDYQEVKQILTGGLEEALETAVAELRDALSPANLLLFLLFGDPAVEALLQKIAEKAEAESLEGTKRAAGGKFAAAKKVLFALKRLGLGIVGKLELLRTQVQNPMLGLAGFVQTRPALTFAFTFAADNIYLVTELKKLDDPDMDLAGFRDQLRLQQDGLQERVKDLVDTIGSFELPDKVLDTQAAIQAVMSMLAEFIGKRLGLKGRIVTFLLKKAGVIETVTRRIAKEIVAEGFDANVYWQTEVVPQIQTDFDAARKAAVERLREVLSAPVFGGVFDALETPSPSEFVMTEGQFEETMVDLSEEKSLYSHGLDLDYQPHGVPPVEGGEPLADPVRGELESRFGHDLTHVRLHPGEAGREMTEAVGAEAVTSGSHVYLRPGLETSFGEGRHILYHELTHVLQQTGARPLGRSHPRTPRAGRPGRGVRVDPAQEAAAERAAAVAASATTTTPLAVGQEEEHAGLQPALSWTAVAKLLDRLAGLTDADEDRQAIDKRIESIRKRGQQPKRVAGAERAISQMATALRKLESDPSKATLPAAFKSVRTDILRRLKLEKAHLEDVGHVIAAAAEESEKPAKKPKPGTKVKPRRFVHLANFSRRLEGYLLSKTGVAVTIEWNLVAKKGLPDSGVVLFDTRRDKEVDGDNPVAEVKVFHVHLSEVFASGLWDEVLKNTWPGKGSDFLDRARGLLRAYLRGQGPVASILKTSGSQFVFTKAVKSDIQELMLAAGGQALTQAPSAGEYTKWDPGTVKATGDLQNVGVRIDAHGSKETQKAPERESHHLTQYLLVEYFHNLSSVHPFHVKWPYPGVVWDPSKKLANTFLNPDGTPDIDLVGQNKGGRGLDMPAISLAATTHRQGRLHVPPRKPDETGYSSAQAHAIHAEFNARLPAELVTANKKNDFAKFKRYVEGDDPAKKAAKQKAAHKQIYSAMQGTYRWMRDYMQGRLEDAMPQLELDYFQGVLERFKLAELKPKQAEAFKTDLTAVAKQHAKARNQELMTKLGWSGKT